MFFQFQTDSKISTDMRSVVERTKNKARAGSRFGIKVVLEGDFFNQL